MKGVDGNEELDAKEDGSSNVSWNARGKEYRVERNPKMSTSDKL